MAAGSDGLVATIMVCSMTPSRFSLSSKSGNFGQLLADGHINVDHAGLLPGLVDHGIDSYGRLTGLAVADDQVLAGRGRSES